MIEEIPRIPSWRKGRDMEGGSRAVPRGDMLCAWTGEIAGPYCRGLWRLQWDKRSRLSQAR